MVKVIYTQLTDFCTFCSLEKQVQQQAIIIVISDSQAYTFDKLRKHFCHKFVLHFVPTVYNLSCSRNTITLCFNDFGVLKKVHIRKIVVEFFCSSV